MSKMQRSNLLQSPVQSPLILLRVVDEVRWTLPGVRYQRVRREHVLMQKLRLVVRWFRQVRPRVSPLPLWLQVHWYAPHRGQKG